MSLSQATLNELQQLIAADADLQTRLQGADDAAQAVEMIVAAAAAKGLQVEPSQLSAYFAAAAKAASAAFLCDAQLASVAGGISSHEFKTLSILTLTLGCMIYSAVHGIPEGHPPLGGCSNVDWSSEPK